jgi:hypothetical protein
MSRRISGQKYALLNKPASLRPHADLLQPNRLDRGAVLVVVLWVLVAFSMLALSFSVAVRTEVNAARNTRNRSGRATSLGRASNTRHMCSNLSFIFPIATAAGGMI